MIKSNCWKIENSIAVCAWFSFILRVIQTTVLGTKKL